MQNDRYDDQTGSVSILKDMDVDQKCPTKRVILKL